MAPSHFHRTDSQPRTRTDVGYVFETINPKVYPVVGLPTRAV